MKRTVTTLAALAAIGSLAAPAGAQDPPLGKEFRADKTFELASRTTATLRMPMPLGAQYNASLDTCWGFSIDGPGVDLAIGEPDVYGATWPEPGRENERDGGVPGAVRQPDGMFTIPASAAKLDAYRLSRGPVCKQIGWDVYDDAGQRKLDEWGNPRPANGARRSATASKRLRSRRLRTARRQLTRGRSAQDGPVTVTFAGIENHRDGTVDMVATVRTGALRGRTTLAMHARSHQDPRDPRPQG